MATLLRSGERIARRPHRCELCNSRIRVGDKHYADTLVHDGRAYDWRTCQACQSDRILAEVFEWAGYPDEGVGWDSAQDWAREASQAGAGHPDLVRRAEAFLARLNGGED